MKKMPLLIAVFAIGLQPVVAPAHEDHEVDGELLASKIRERGHDCASVTEARETSENPTVMAVKCSDNNTYRLVITATDLEVTKTSPPSPPDETE